MNSSESEFKLASSVSGEYLESSPFITVTEAKLLQVENPNIQGTVLRFEQLVPGHLSETFYLPYSKAIKKYPMEVLDYLSKKIVPKALAGSGKAQPRKTPSKQKVNEYLDPNYVFKHIYSSEMRSQMNHQETILNCDNESDDGPQNLQEENMHVHFRLHYTIKQKPRRKKL